MISFQESILRFYRRIRIMLSNVVIIKQCHRVPAAAALSDQLVVITVLSLLVLWEMHLHVSIPTGSPDTANELKSIGLSLVFKALGSL